METCKKILIVVLTHSNYFQIFPQVWENVNRIKVPTGYQVDIIAFTDIPKDTVLSKNFLNYIKDNNVDLRTITISMEGFIRHEPKGHIHPRTNWTEEQTYKVHKIRNKYLEIVKKGGYEWLLNVDGDILPPKDCLIKLLEGNRKCIGGWAFNKKHGGLEINPNKIEFGIIFEVVFTGTYCLLEHKDVFNNVPYTLWENKYNPSDDRKRNIDIRKAGFKIYCHPDIYCKHIIEETGETYKDINNCDKFRI